MTTATITLTATQTTETIPANRLAVAPAVFSRLCRESTACGGNLGTPDQLHITTDSDDADDLDALDDLLREHSQTVVAFEGRECVVLLPKQRVDGSDVWARCDVSDDSAESAPAPYAVSYRVPVDADEATRSTVSTLNDDGAHGDLPEILATCTEVGCDADLFDAAGFRRGWVHADGSYSLT